MKFKTSNKNIKTVQPMLTETDLQAIGNLVGGLMDKQSAVLASKTDLVEMEARADKKFAELEKNLKQYVGEGFEAVMEGMGNLEENFVTKEKFDTLVGWTREISQKVGVKPKL